MTAESSAALLRRAAERVEQALADTHDANLADWRKADRRRDMIPWQSLMAPEIAGPLASWLRAEADVCDADASTWHPSWTQVREELALQRHAPAVAVALALLGETPDPARSPQEENR